MIYYLLFDNKFPFDINVHNIHEENKKNKTERPIDLIFNFVYNIIFMQRSFFVLICTNYSLSRGVKEHILLYIHSNNSPLGNVPSDKIKHQILKGNMFV